MFRLVVLNQTLKSRYHFGTSGAAGSLSMLLRCELTCQMGANPLVEVCGAGVDHNKSISEHDN